VEKNRLKELPQSIGDLRLLQTLNLKGRSLLLPEEEEVRAPCSG